MHKKCVLQRSPHNLEVVCSNPTPATKFRTWNKKYQDRALGVSPGLRVYGEVSSRAKVPGLFFSRKMCLALFAGPYENVPGSLCLDNTGPGLSPVNRRVGRKKAQKAQTDITAKQAGSIILSS